MTVTSPDVRAELEAVRKRNGGILRPTDVVSFAANENTALHRMFEWDDSKAAHEYRLEQARHVIRFSVRIIEGQEEPMRMYVSLTDDRRDGDSYRTLDDVMSDPDMRGRLLAQALGEAQSWRRRYERLTELTPIFEAIERQRTKPVRKTRKTRRRSR